MRIARQFSILLIAYNHTAGGDPHHEPLAILIKDPVSHQTLGGLWEEPVTTGFRRTLRGARATSWSEFGFTHFDAGEDIARKRGCIGAWLDTFAFQAPEFYKKQGYESPARSRIILADLTGRF